MYNIDIFMDKLPMSSIVCFEKGIETDEWYNLVQFV